MTSRPRSWIIPAVILAGALAAIAYLLLANPTSHTGEDRTGETAVSSGSMEPDVAAGQAVASSRAEQQATTTAPGVRAGFATSSGPGGYWASGIVSEVVEPYLPQEVDLERREDGDPLASGEIDAPVGIVMYSDFQCSFCALWSAQTLPEILPYVEAGSVRLESRDIAIFGPDSHRAALAAYAAGMQGRYLEFLTELFEAGVPPADLSDAALEQYARGIGLDLTRFNEDRAGKQAAAAVEENIAEAEDNGVFSTPAFLIDGRPIIGAQPTQTFLDAIEAALKR